MSNIASNFAVYRFVLSALLAFIGAISIWLGYRLFASGSGLFRSVDKLAIRNREFTVSVTGMSAGSALMATSIFWGYWAHSSVPRLEAMGDQVKIVSAPLPEQHADEPANVPEEKPRSIVRTVSLTPQLLIFSPAVESDQAAAYPRRTAVDKFQWPVEGKIISSFGAGVNGQQNDGVNIAVPQGTPVMGAQDGVVAYAGNELKGYGNLILVRHPGGFVTAYAHLNDMLVKRGDAVKSEQIIGHVGRTGNVSVSQLHFELRKGSTPVDPTKFLPKM